MEVLKVHKVKKGESLYKIAEEYYGMGFLWNIIYNDNKKKIGSNPDLIKEGMNLKIRQIKRVIKR